MSNPPFHKPCWLSSAISPPFVYVCWTYRSSVFCLLLAFIRMSSVISCSFCCCHQYHLLSDIICSTVSFWIHIFCYFVHPPCWRHIVGEASRCFGEGFCLEGFSLDLLGTQSGWWCGMRAGLNVAFWSVPCSCRDFSGVRTCSHSCQLSWLIGDLGFVDCCLERFWCPLICLFTYKLCLWSAIRLHQVVSFLWFFIG